MPDLTLAAFQAHLFKRMAVIVGDVPAMIEPTAAFEGVPEFGEEQFEVVHEISPFKGSIAGGSSVCRTF